MQEPPVRELSDQEGAREEDIVSEEEEAEVPAEDPACKVKEMVTQKRGKNHKNDNLR